MKTTVAVALSGGIDSAVTAALLKREGHRVIGLHFLTGTEFSREELTPPSPPKHANSDKCGIASLAPPVNSDLRTRLVNPWVEEVADQIGVSLEVVDCAEAFKQEVVRYFINSYCSGKTPNPCMICNARIKFRVLLERARELGASSLATGHYARIRQEENGKYCLLKGKDRNKDQSYFLALLTQQQLGSAMFPLGKYRKTQVRAIGRDMGLSSCVSPESQELCFVRDETYKEFLARSGRLLSGPGPIVNTRGEVLGRHRGLHSYTIGQRKGIGIPAADPYYVIRLDTEHNRLVVGSKRELGITECRVTHVNWIKDTPPDRPLSVLTRIRYRHKETESILTPVSTSDVTVQFLKTQYAVTPGQAAVFYDGEKVLGGGWIVGH